MRQNERDLTMIYSFECLMQLFISTGIALFYTFSFLGLQLLGGGTDMNEARSLSYRRDIVDIYSNSWGPRNNGRHVGGPRTLTARALQNGVREVKR